VQVQPHLAYVSVDGADVVDAGVGDVLVAASLIFYASFDLKTTTKNYIAWSYLYAFWFY
jgi:hypothetical protein